MNERIIILSIIISMVIGSLGASGLHVETESEKVCGCNDSEDNYLSLSEQDEYVCGLVEPEDWQDYAPFDLCVPLSSLPDKHDWRDYGLPNIRNQGNCGSCWAFATVAPLECNIKIQDGISVDLSEQWLVSCNRDGYGCNGGWFAHEYHSGERSDSCGGYGAVMETSFPYVAHDAQCNCPYDHHYMIDSWSYIGSKHSTPSVSSIQQAIYDYGPVAAGIYVGSDFRNYNSGIFSSGQDGTPNHAITLVGWHGSANDPNGYWILRNSWGTGWGENGYMRIKYGTSSVGYGASYVVYNGEDGSLLIKKYGRETSSRSGDIKNHNSNWVPGGGGSGYSVRMGEGIFAGDANAIYEFDIGFDKIKDVLSVGIQFCDHGWFGDGPCLWIYNWETSSYSRLGKDLGNNDKFKWTWIEPSNPNNYVNDDDIIRIKVWTEDEDDTILDEISIKYVPDPPKPDLDCSGNIDKSKIEPGSTIYGSFKVKNIGESNSKLNWKIDSYPDWGKWEFSPESGTELTDSKTINVNVEIPDEKFTTLSGEIKVVNMDDVNDCGSIDVSISCRSKSMPLVNSVLISFLERFPILKEFFSFSP